MSCPKIGLQDSPPGQEGNLCDSKLMEEKC